MCTQASLKRKEVYYVLHTCNTSELFHVHTNAYCVQCCLFLVLIMIGRLTISKAEKFINFISHSQNKDRHVDVWLDGKISRLLHYTVRSFPQLDFTNFVLNERCRQFYASRKLYGSSWSNRTITSIRNYVARSVGDRQQPETDWTANVFISLFQSSMRLQPIAELCIRNPYKARTLRPSASASGWFRQR